MVRNRRGIAAAGAAAALLAFAAACGSGTGSSASSPSGSSGQTSASPASMAPSSPAAAAGQPADPAAAKAQITQNWAKFFKPGTSTAEKAGLLQNGDMMKPVLQGFSSDPRMGEVTAKVNAVSFTSPTAAKVTYALSLKGATVLPSATGQAVLEKGTWKVADSTLCSLVQLSGKSVPGC